jgi:hypothetical protein
VPPNFICSIFLKASLFTFVFKTIGRAKVVNVVLSDYFQSTYEGHIGNDAFCYPPKFSFKDPLSPNRPQFTFPQDVETYSYDSVDFLCSEILMINVGRILSCLFPVSVRCFDWPSQVFAALPSQVSVRCFAKSSVRCFAKSSVRCFAKSSVCCFAKSVKGP